MNPQLSKETIVEWLKLYWGVILAVIFVIIYFSAKQAGIPFTWKSLMGSSKTLLASKVASPFSGIEDISTFSLLDIVGQYRVGKDKDHIYLCDGLTKTCTVQSQIKDPKSYQRLSNIYGEDATTVYVYSLKEKQFVPFIGADRATFRTYFEPNTNEYGLYGWDNYHIYKFDEILPMKPNYNAFRSFLFQEPSNDLRPLTQIDGDMQYVSDGEMLYHGAATTTEAGTKVLLTPMPEADPATFTIVSKPVPQNGGYYKYAYDKNRVYCDNVERDASSARKHYVSKGYVSYVSSSSASLRVTNPNKETVYIDSVPYFLAQTDDLLFVNCELVKGVDLKTFESVASENAGINSNYFKDKNSLYYLRLGESKKVSFSKVSGVTLKNIRSCTTLLSSDLGPGERAVEPCDLTDGVNYVIDGKKTLEPKINPKKYESAQKVGHTDIYIYLDKETKNPSILFKSEVDTGVTQAKTSINWELVSDLKIPDISVKEFQKSLKPISATASFTSDGGLEIKDMGKTYNISSEELGKEEASESGQLKTVAEIEKKHYDTKLQIVDSFSKDGKLYFLLSSTYSGHSNSMCGASAYIKATLIEVNNGVNKVYKSYNYFDGCNGDPEPGMDGSVDLHVYRDDKMFMFSNERSIALLNYDHPEWGFVTRNNSY